MRAGHATELRGRPHLRRCDARRVCVGRQLLRAAAGGAHAHGLLSTGPTTRPSRQITTGAAAHPRLSTPFPSMRVYAHACACPCVCTPMRVRVHACARLPAPALPAGPCSRRAPTPKSAPALTVHPDRPPIHPTRSKAAQDPTQACPRRLLSECKASPPTCCRSALSRATSLAPSCMRCTSAASPSYAAAGRAPAP
jgi:hypothetical protein